jgi:hypothetical protein
MKNNKYLESCVFYFFNEQEIQIKKQKIHKIVTFNPFIQNELTNHKILFDVNDRKKHFYICENVSELKITEIQEYDTKIEDINSTIDNTILFEFEKQDLIYFKNNLKNLFEGCNYTKYILTIIQFYKHLLHSLQLLVDNHIFNNHINFDSIVIDKYDCPLLSNFTFSIYYLHPNIDEHIKQFIVAYEPSYIEWPIELHILSYLLTNKLNSLSNHNIETIIDDIVKHNKILNSFGDTVVSLYKTEASIYFNKYVNQSYHYILSDILQFVHTWDNYSLSILFLRILIGIHRSIGIKNKFIILFMKLLVGNIHLNPLKRLSINKTKEKFNDLLNSIEPKDYKDVIKLMSA